MCGICGRSHEDRACPVVAAVVETVKMMWRRRSEGLCPCCGCEPDWADLVEDAEARRMYDLEGVCRKCQQEVSKAPG